MRKTKTNSVKQASVPEQPKQKNGGTIKLTDGEKNVLTQLITGISQGKAAYYDLIERAEEIRNSIRSQQNEFQQIVQRKVAVEGLSGSGISFDLDAGTLTVNPGTPSTMPTATEE